jgi:hypothetical protein
MQHQFVGDIGDFGKVALLRHLMPGRRLAVCWYLTGDERQSKHREKYFDYLQRPDEFRHLAPEIFDALTDIVGNAHRRSRGVLALEASGLLEGARFHRKEVPKTVSLRRRWADELVEAVGDADLIFLDPDNGMQGARLSPKHVALSEIATLRRAARTLVFLQRQTGRRSEITFLAGQLRSLGCQRIELVRFRLVASRFYVAIDHDEAQVERIAEFTRKWGRWVQTYRL